MMTTDHPLISVIVPAHACEQALSRCLGALERSDYPEDRWELIVVDDSSPDDTPLVASRHADLLVRLSPKPRGPAYARNRGAELARGEILVFLDSDVLVRPQTVRLLVEALEEDPTIGAVFGSYDDAPDDPSPVSRYRNLLHHYVHQRGAGDAETFWAGCGAVRRGVFRTAGMYDEWHFSRPQIEDIELGRRIRKLRDRIVLRPEIQVTHLKRWTLRGVLATDFRSRGVPWSRLLIQEGAGSSGSEVLNVSRHHQICTMLVCLGLATALGGVFWKPGLMLTVAAGLILTALVLNLRFYAFLVRRAGLAVLGVALPLHLVHYVNNGLSVLVGWLAHEIVGEPHPPPDVAALSEIGIRTWPPVPCKPSRNSWSENDE